MAVTGATVETGFLQNRWWIVGASAIGNCVGPGVALVFMFGVFLQPVTADLGWTRGQFASAFLVTAFTSPICAPLFGMLMDRYGIRRVALPAITLYAIMLSGFAFLGQAKWPAYVFFACAAGFGQAGGPIVYSKAVTAWFDKERGLALGIATAGVGLGTIWLPPLAQYMIGHYGWRLAYIGVALTTWLLAFSAIAAFLREPPEHRLRMREAAAHADANAGGPQPFGLTTRAAILHTRQFTILATIYFLQGIATAGSIIHMVPMAIDRGYTPAIAAAMLSASGMAALISRIIVGPCLDWFNGPVFAAIAMLMPACGVALLASGAVGWVPLFAAILLGFGLGAEIDFLGFFVSRYFGQRSFGALYGLGFACFTVGVGIGPVILGRGYDSAHSYGPVLTVYVAVLVVAATLFLGLGKYKYPKGTG